LAAPEAVVAPQPHRPADSGAAIGHAPAIANGGDSSDDDVDVLDQLHLPPVVFNASWHPADIIACHVARLHMHAGHTTLLTKTIDDVARKFPVTGAILRRRRPADIKRRVGGKSFARPQADGTPHAFELAARRVTAGTERELAVYLEHTH
jgi:hypothetical protein